MRRTREIDYRLRGLATGNRSGAHRARSTGEGQEFSDLAPFLSHPDMRHLDLRRSLTDPTATLWVRRQRQLARIQIWLLADLSASMQFEGACRKMTILADLIEALAHSASRMGDRFGCLGCAEQPRPEWHLPPTRTPGPALRLAERLRGYRPTGVHARGLLSGIDYLPSGRALVFLVSDFHLPLASVRRMLERFGAHHLVPVVIWDSVEQGNEGQGRGPARYADLEGGGDRVLWLRAALRERLRRSFDDRREKLTALFRLYGREPLFLEGPFSAEAVNHYFRRFG